MNKEYGPGEEVPGTTTMGLVMFVRQHKLNEEAKKRIAGGLDQDVRDIFFDQEGEGLKYNKIWPTDPYSYKAFGQFLDSVVHELGESSIKDFGYAAATMGMVGMYSMYAKDTFRGTDEERINIIINKTPDIWTDQYNKGSMGMVEIEPGVEALATLTGFSEMTVTNCKLVGYWMEQVSNIITEKQCSVEVNYKPNGKNGVDCEFRLYVDQSKDADLTEYLAIKKMVDDAKALKQKARAEKKGD